VSWRYLIRVLEIFEGCPEDNLSVPWRYLIDVLEIIDRCPGHILIGVLEIFDLGNGDI